MVSRNQKNDLTCLQESFKTIVINCESLDYRKNILNFFHEPLCDHFCELITKCPVNPPIVFSKRALLLLLRSKLLHHRWGDVSLLLLIVAHLNWKYNYNNDFAEIIWRVGIEVIFHHPIFCKDFNIVSVHKQSMGSFLCALDSNHVMLEYVFALLSSQNYTEAFNELKYHAVVGKSLTHKKRRICDIEIWKATMDAYLSMVCYISWKLKRVDASTIFSEECSDNLGMVAIQHFNNVVHKPGCWDIFITKQAELLQFFGNLSQLESDLCTYVVNHPDNINALKYLYLYLIKFCTMDNTDLKVTTLLKLHRLSPTDPLIIDLYMFLIENGSRKPIDEEIIERNVIICTEVLLNMLDYPVWAGSVDLWTKLASILQTISNTMSKIVRKKIVKSVWVYSERKMWWPFFHFTIESLNYDSLVLIRLKFSVSKIFMSKKCDYNKFTRKKLKNHIYTC